MHKNKLRHITLIAMLTAIEIVLSRFLSFNIWNIRLGLGFVPVVLAALLFGPKLAGIVAALGDLLGALLFPIAPFFPGFTLCAFLQGLIFGLCLAREQSLSRNVLAVLLVQIICTLLINSLCISLLYSAPYLPLLVTRLLQAGIMSTLQLAVIPLIYKLAELTRQSYPA